MALRGVSARIARASFNIIIIIRHFYNVISPCISTTPGRVNVETRQKI